MKKLLYLLLAILGISLTACSGNDDDDVTSALNSVALQGSSSSQIKGNTLTVKLAVKNATEDMDFTLYYGVDQTDNVDLSSLKSAKMDYDKANKTLNAVLTDVDYTRTLYGCVVVKDTKTNQSRRLNSIALYRTLSF